MDMVKKVSNMAKFTKYLNATSDGFNYLSMIALFVMMALGTLDVLGRYLFRKPIPGTYETFEILMAAIVLFSLAGLQRKDEHVSLNILWNHFGPRLRYAVGLATSVILTCFFGIATWQGVVAVINYYYLGQFVSNLGIPRYIPQIISPLGTAILTIVLGTQAVMLIGNIRRQ